MDLHQEIAIMKKSIQKIVLLQEIHEELESSKDKRYARIESEYSRDQILKLSLYLKHKIKSLELKEKL